MAELGGVMPTGAGFISPRCVVQIPLLLSTARYPKWLQESRSYREIYRFDACPCYTTMAVDGEDLIDQLHEDPVDTGTAHKAVRAYQKRQA